MRRIHRIYLFITLVFSLSATALWGQTGRSETGIASFYHDKFVGRRTANGEIFSQEKFTAAHKTLPLGTWVRVTNLQNDSSVVVRINDRMPAWNKRSIDLTRAGAKKLNYISSGVTRVKIEVINGPGALADARPADLPLEPIKMVVPVQISCNTTATISPIRDLIDFEVYTQNLTNRRKSNK